ncbi:hypothetical protein cypCar_00029572, partial [Cyprinus carpio]
LKDPCSDVTCSFGSTCIQSSDGLSAKCMCPLSCENVPKNVVCGSDGLDYQSECELNMKACAAQKNIRVHHQGRCDPCSDTLNSLSMACRVNPKTYKQFTFAPADSCPPDSTPICASDGHTYDSECQMERTALQNNLELKKISSGSCKEKGGCPNGCKFNAMCLLENGEFRCSCDPIQCDGTYKPLCGMDGKTYLNDCERKLEECWTETDIPVKQQGPCDLNLESPCLKKTCEFGAVCVVKNSEPVCECSDACPQNQDPVCGSDGHTYSSSCQMKAMGCALQKQIQMKHKGPCGNNRLGNKRTMAYHKYVHPLDLSEAFETDSAIYSDSADSDELDCPDPQSMSCQCDMHDIKLELSSHPHSMRQVVNIIIAVERLKHIKNMSSGKFCDEELLGFILENVIEVQFSMSTFVSSATQKEAQPVCLGISNSNLYLACTQLDGSSPVLILKEASGSVNTIKAGDPNDSLLFFRKETGTRYNTFESVKYPGWFISTAFDDWEKVEMNQMPTTRTTNFTLEDQKRI